MNRSLLFLGFVTLVVTACSDGAPPPGGDAAAAIDAAATPLDGGGCGGPALCDRTIDGCQVAISREACLGFYDPATTTCADLAGYTTCNCACIDEPTCDGYFVCGTTCFEDWC